MAGRPTFILNYFLLSREEDLNLQPMVYDTIALPIELSRLAVAINYINIIE